MATSKDANKRKRPSRPIYCVVVESHQHVLEHIHTVLRKERLLNRDWSMLHFDAHPDLACPHDKVPAKACFVPRETFNNDKNLYELLDSTATGIAEWILPLVLAANLRSVRWVKPRMENSDNAPTPPYQLPLGKHSFHVGASVLNCQSKIESFMDLPPSATVKVDWPHPYYLEDGCTVHYGSCKGQESFVLKQPLNLEISELSTNKSYNPPSKTTTQHNLWSLDICLDYFVCQNPFLVDLEAKNAAYTQALLHAVYNSRFCNPTIMNMTNDPASIQEVEAILQEHQQNIRNYWTMLVTFLKDSIAKQSWSNDSLQGFLVHYKDWSKGGTLLIDLVKTLVATKEGQAQELVAMTEQALPNLIMPHQSTPASGFSMETIQPLLERVCQEIEGLGAEPPPFIITFARSSNDGFTPNCIADELQNKLIWFLHSHFCGCQACPLTTYGQSTEKARANDDCQFRLIFDYGKWEGTEFA